MNTREAIIHLAEDLIREKGINAFSYYDISRAIGIKTSSIHYYFPTKTDLAVAAIREQMNGLDALMDKLSDKSPQEKLEGFMTIYSSLQSENRVCMVGSLATDLQTVDEKVADELKQLTNNVLEWLTGILEEGKEKDIFDFNVPARSKALLIATNMLGSVQVARLYGKADFNEIKNSILKEVKK